MWPWLGHDGSPRDDLRTNKRKLIQSIGEGYVTLTKLLVEMGDSEIILLLFFSFFCSHIYFAVLKSVPNKTIF